MKYRAGNSIFGRSMKIYTTGVYGATEQEFFQKLAENRIDAFCDIRRRRGVRDSEYVLLRNIWEKQTINILKILKI